MSPLGTLALISCRTPRAGVPVHDLGGKGENLFRLREMGFRVPPWIVVSRRVFDDVIAPTRPAISAALRGLGVHDADAVAAASTRVRRLIDECEWPDWLVVPLAAEIDATLPATGSLAVRSAAVGEDSAESSFAGLMDTRLGVERRAVADAIKHVWASAFSERALLYRIRKGLDVEGISTAVVVQEMVEARAAGVLFTRDPVGASRICVISAAFGLGEGVVGGTVETDTYRIGWDGEEAEADVRTKDARVVLDRDAPGGTRREPLPESLRARPVLDSAQIRALRDVGVKAERSFGSPQDLEWAFDASGRLFLLQARPIVRPEPRSVSTARRVWDSSNIVESYPGLTLPLTFSFVRHAYEETFSRAARPFLRGAGVRPRPEVFRSLVGLLDGRVYYNLLNWYEMFSYLPAPERHQEAWNHMIGIAEGTTQPKARLGAWPRVLTLATAVAILARARSISREFQRRFAALQARHRDSGSMETTVEEIVATYTSLESEVASFWHLSLYIDLCAIRYHEWLTSLGERWGIEAALRNALLPGEPGVESVEPVVSLLAIAGRVGEEPAARALFEEGDDHAVWRAIESDSRLRPLREALEAHLQAFGDRGIEELKLETPSFRDDPSRLVALVRQYQGLHLTVSGLREEERRRRAEAEDALRRCPLSLFQRALFAFVLGQARLALRSRENMRFARSRLFGIVRRLFRRLGEMFASVGLLAQPSDVFFLTLDEALGVVEGTAVTRDLEALVAIRKAEYATYDSRAPLDRVETVGIPVLAHKMESRPEPAGGRTLRGTGCSPGRAAGIAAVVTDPRRAVAGRDRILVARSTDPGWVFLMIASAGLVVEKGSLLSHTAIIGRELGIPTVVGVRGATERVPDGAAITIDGATGEVTWL